MADEVSGPTGAAPSDGGPPSFPGNAPPAPPPPPPPPPLPPPAGAPPVGPPAAPPSYPAPGQFPPPSYAQPSGIPYASWGLRLGGFLIDAVIFIVIGGILFAVFHHDHTLQLHMMARRGQRRRTYSGLALIITGVLSLAYATILCGGRRGQTVGMMVVRVRVVRDGSLDSLGYGRAFGRAIVQQVFQTIGVLVTLGFLVGLLDGLWPLWDKKRQTLHDKVVRTVVLRVQN